MKLDKIDIIIIFVMIISLIVGATFYYIQIVNDCTSQPLVYGAKELTERAGYEFLGYGLFKVPLGILSPKITFNSTSIIIND